MHESAAMHAMAGAPASGPPPPPPPIVGQHGCPAPPQVAHKPGMPIPVMRPVHARPAVQVPLFPVPQQGCPAPPQVPHWLPVDETMHERAVMQAVTAPAFGPPPPIVEQQGCPVPPQVAHIPGAI
jgi:hypothetical protein